MKRYLLFIIFLLSIALCSSAKQVSENEALSAAQNFFSQSTMSGVMKAKPVSGLNLAYTAVDKNATANLYYVFNCGTTDGYVIVSGDDRAESILGYSDNGSFDYNNIPENMRWWLSEYQRQLQFLVDNPGFEAAPPVVEAYNEVSPLLGNIAWDQGDPYNLYCPPYYKGLTRKTSYTGCEATAMAQIMRYYKWPIQGTGSHSYTTTDKNGAVSDMHSVFSDHTYDWNNMTETYSSSSTTAQKIAVAQLMVDCGISVDMAYNDDGFGSSGAISNKAGYAFSTYFGYDKGVRLVSRDYYANDWDALMYNELKNGRPILYTGVHVDATTQAQAGHAFVFDGVNAAGYFHVNWGWSGVDNGYFKSTALNPGSSQGSGSGSDYKFNYYQDATIGIQKPVTGSTTGAYNMTADSFSTTATSVAAGSTARLAIDKFINQGTDSISLASVGFLLYDADGTLKRTSSGAFSHKAAIGIGWSFSLDYTMPMLSDGVYRLYFYYKVTGESDWRPVHILNTASQYIQFTVSNLTATITGGGVAPLTDFAAPTISLVSQTGNSFTDISGNQKVSITAAAGAAIHYTTDGSVPTTSSPTYSAPFAISSTQTVNAIAVNYIDKGSASTELVAAPTLADLLTHGVEGNKYTIGNYLINEAQGTIGDKCYVFVTDRNDNWIRLEINSANSDKFAAISVLDNGKMAGIYSNGTVNPTLSLGDLVPAPSGVYTSYTPPVYDLAEKYNPKADEVHYILGYYNNGKLRGYSPNASQQGQAIELDLSWVPTATFTEGAQYQVKAVAQLKAAWDAENGAPAKKVKASDDYAFRNYTAYVVFAPQVPTSVTNVSPDGVSIVATKGLITVTGAQDVKVYNMSGAIVSTAHEAFVPAGFYTVIADGHAKKVLVR
jgi:hypothetical protein